MYKVQYEYTLTYVYSMSIHKSHWSKIVIRLSLITILKINPNYYFYRCYICKK